MSLVVFDPTNSKHTALIPSFADIHIQCIEIDETIATFMPPLNRHVIIDWWKERAFDAAEGKRVIIMAFSEDTDGAEQLAGFVILYRPLIEPSPFRGTVEKLLVSPKFRRQGLARKLMEKLEEEAKARGQTLLTLDTTTGGSAEMVYPKLGYIQVLV
ncbi:acetyltransferase [Mycena albidolilacea]|uniref:Acetyltransferase n=1 Tax=Mycena albidolilacea TaxID=1033008 RepID=A0AAD7A8B9_9AGAR|nr:acetyltransferase [Mycena albidolilacea]